MIESLPLAPKHLKVAESSRLREKAWVAASQKVAANGLGLSGNTLVTPF